MLTDHFGQVIQGQPTLLIVDVSLGQFDIHQRAFFELLASSGTKIIVHFIAEKLVHHVIAIGLAHDHQRGVLSQRFTQQRCALDFGSDDLVSPPLVSHFVGDDIRHEIDIIGFAKIGNKAHRFRVGHRTGEGLCETRYTWKLDDTGLLVFIRPKFFGAIFKGVGDRPGHFGHVPGMFFVIVNLRIDISDFTSLDFVASRDKRVKVQRGVVDSVTVIVSAVFLPLLDEGTWSHSDLIFGGTDDRLDSDPIGIFGNVMHVASRIAVPFEFR